MLVEIKKFLDQDEWFSKFGALKHITTNKSKLDIFSKNNLKKKNLTIKNKSFLVEVKESTTILTKVGRIKITNIFYILNIIKSFKFVCTLINGRNKIVFINSQYLI